MVSTKGYCLGQPSLSECSPDVLHSNFQNLEPMAMLTVDDGSKKRLVKTDLFNQTLIDLIKVSVKKALIIGRREGSMLASHA